MKCRLYVKETGSSSRFELHNTEFASEEAAQREGEKLCNMGNVEEFEVWGCLGQFKRVSTIQRQEG
jgi:hypothetical protein